jgi:hypothetical protein
MRQDLHKCIRTCVCFVGECGLQHEIFCDKADDLSSSLSTSFSPFIPALLIVNPCRSRKISQGSHLARSYGVSVCEHPQYVLLLVLHNPGTNAHAHLGTCAVAKVQKKIQAKYDKIVEDPDQAHKGEGETLDRLPGALLHLKQAERVALQFKGPNSALECSFCLVT